MDQPILKFTGKYAFLSNFWSCRVRGIDGEIYPSVEHAFQAAKALPERYDIRAAFRVAPSCSDVKKAGRRIQLRPDWEDVKDSIMYQLVKDKFMRNDYLRTLLISTGTAHLEEGNNHNDKYWGTVDNVGKNKLGNILMQVRSELSD